MKLALALVALAGCSYKDRSDPPPPRPADELPVPPVTPTPLQARAIEAADEPLTGIALPITMSRCDKPTVNECPQITRTHVKVPVKVVLPPCSLATTLEIRDAHGPGLMRAALVIRSGPGAETVTLVDTLSAWKTYDDNGKGVPRLDAATASCSNDLLRVELAVHDGTQKSTIHVTCANPATGFACVRDAAMDVGGPALSRAILDVKRVVEAHQWRALLDLCDPAHKKMQLVQMRQHEATYLAEIMGLNYIDNALVSDDREITFDTLSTIDKVELAEVSVLRDTYNAIGIATLKDGRRLRWLIHLQRNGDRWLLFGAVG